MTRIKELFERKKEILSVYFTAGFPALDDTRLIIESLVSSGADMIEIGIPFSDPLADGPVIQHSSEVALNNGMSLHLLFDQLKDIRKTLSSQIPLVLMGYLNPVMQFGKAEFCRRAKEVGIDGIIIPDLPMEEYLESDQALFREHGLTNIFLVTPQTSEARIRMIDKNSDGFIYLVSSASTTGVKEEVPAEQAEYFKRIKSMNLNNPLLIGFGIHDRKSFTRACESASGAFIGSAFIKALEQDKDLSRAIHIFVSNLRQGSPVQNLRA
jgi:tryptophan synthase alpha chain